LENVFYDRGDIYVIIARSYLLEKIKNKQVIITCTDADEIGIKGNANFIHIKEGKVV